ncbi:unnamed protein product [Closterium sp. Yama58-4]|nr:unnamed protein product [Closterium sp. Yama58-4]
MRVSREVAAVAVWMGLAGVLAGLVAWRVQKGFDDNRKAELDTWCAGRTRSLQQQFMQTADHVQALAGLASVFGGVRENPWGVGECMSPEMFVQYVHATITSRPWVHAVIYLLPLNHTDRAAYERQMRCRLVDMLDRPRPPADWYMVFRYWYNEVPLATLLAATPCKDARTNPSYGPQLGGMVERADRWLTTPYVLDNGNAGIGMAFPLFRAGVSLASPLAERQAAFIGAMAASVDFKRLASAIILDVLQDVNYTLEIYDVTDTFASPPSGPRLLYGMGDLPQGDPQQVSKVIPPSTDAMLQPHRHKAVHPINLTDSSRSFQVWCRFAGSDEAHSWVAIVLGMVIVVVAALLAGIAVSVVRNTREARRKTAVVEGFKESTQRKERNKSAFIASTAHELRTPIIGMKGMLEQLREGHMEREMKEDVWTAVEEAERVLALINTVLDISKAEAGCMQLERLPFAPRGWLQAALQQHEARAAEAGLQLVTTCHLHPFSPPLPPSPPPTPSLSRAWLHQLHLPSVRTHPLRSPFCNSLHRFCATTPFTVLIPSAPLLYPLHASQVVDDNAINRRVAASTLARYGAEVALAESGEAALRLLQARHSFRLVLMDLLMPGLDGFQTTARLRALEAAAQRAWEEQVEQGVQACQWWRIVGRRAEKGAGGGRSAFMWWPCQQMWTALLLPVPQRLAWMVLCKSH